MTLDLKTSHQFFLFVKKKPNTWNTSEKYTATTKSGQRFKTEEENLVDCNGNFYSIYFSVLNIEANNTFVVS